MTQRPDHADDSCSVNQTVPAGSRVVEAPPALVPDHIPPASSSLPLPEQSNNANNNNRSGTSRAAAAVEHDAPLGSPRAVTAPSSDNEKAAPADQVQPHAAAGNTADNSNGDDDFPEGGLEAWLVVFGSFCAMISVYGLINSAAIFESYFSNNQLKGYDSSTIGWIFSVYLFLVFFAGIQAGPIFDAYGPRWLVAVGSIMVVASQMLLSVSTEYYQILLTYSVLGGLGGALLNVPAYGVIAHFFKARRGLATGMAATSGSIGGIAFPFLFQATFPRLGFGWSTRISGFILLALAVPANLLVRSRLTPTKKKLKLQQQQQQDVTEQGTVTAVTAGPPSTKSSVMPDWSLFKDSKYLLCCLGLWFMEWGIFIPLTFIVSYAADHKASSSSSSHNDTAGPAYTLLALLNVGSFFGRFLPGFLADKVGRFNVIVVTNGLCAATILGLWLPVAWVPAGPGADALLIVFVIVFGFMSGSNLGLFPVCIGQLCEARDYGRFYSTALMLGSFGTLTSVPIGGALLSVGGGGGAASEQGWNALIVFAALSYFIAMSCFLAARVLATSWRVKEVF
ncbi:major facilitator superfamily domain-containing protein [Microdochium trichocladiopsis]|uniref:Major facilitator superfamily domain-containing protein n=1 Tax=Microdochium trichocladiopsis TaxID=1682393 RepID=A0A9P8YBX3_9PEZI|nr:major facilitator superfamily domain-containing protein [Microdochium trichocladiopsis]KAH7035556.1 major facilitator superfamily domain-containing protein [Microdochium trichocladiopsis]